jgi:amidase
MLARRDPSQAFVPYPAVPVPNAEEGPLAGTRFAVKDVFDVAGYPTSAGQPTYLALSGTRPTSAALVQAVLNAGAGFVGKTHMSELAFSLSGQNCHFGTPQNPAAPGRLPGGSSSGSASAVASRACEFALGTDTAGSVRLPASYQGLYGLRTTHGRLSLAGCLPLAPSFDAAGWFARDAATFQRVAMALLGPDSNPLPPRPDFIFAEDAFALLSGKVIARCRSTLGLLEHAPGSRSANLAHVSLSEIANAGRILQAVEAWRCHGAFIESRAPVLGTDVARRFAFGRNGRATEVKEADAVREQLRHHLQATIGGAAVMVLPTTPHAAPLLASSESEIEKARDHALHLLYPASLAGLPQVTIPVLTSEGAPLGLSLIGPAGSDRSLVEIAAGVASGWAVALGSEIVFQKDLYIDA